jgi:ABC-type phosphate transport system substrate-binding protein
VEESVMVRRVLAAAALAALIAVPAAAQPGYRVIVNTANPVSSISKEKVWRLFLEKAVWKNGDPVTPVDLPPTSPVREVFSSHALGLPAWVVAETWGRLADDGGHPPPALASDGEVLAYVRLKPGAIGYVSLDADVQGVKVVFVATPRQIADSFRTRGHAWAHPSGAVLLETRSR